MTLPRSLAFAAIALSLACSSVLSSPGVSAAGGVTIDCDTPNPTASLPTRPGPIRWGINPRVQAGQVGVEQAAVPAIDAAQLGALGTLTGGSAGQAGPAPFVVRLNRLFFPERTGQAAALAHDLELYGGAGYQVELQLRFHPPDVAPGVPDRQGGDPAAFARWAAELVHRVSANPALVAVQVVNEANVNYSFDSSDGYYSQAMEAMRLGVIAVKRQVVADRRPVRVGTNWVYRGMPQVDKAFWDTFRNDSAARSALDFMGLDAYPGTFPFPNQPSSYYRALAGDLDLTRQCFMAYAGINRSVPIWLEETGWPTLEPTRPATTQQVALQQLTSAARDYAGTYNVSDFRWFNLRDADSAAPNFQQHFGLLMSDYTRKPAFCAYRLVVTRRADCPLTTASVSPSPGPPGQPSEPAPPRQLPGTSADQAFAVAPYVALAATLLAALVLGRRRPA